MDDLMIEEVAKVDPEMDASGTETPETELPETADPDGDAGEGGSQTEDPEEEKPETEEPEEVPEEEELITVDEIVRRFGALLALSGDEAEQQRELCAAAMRRMEQERNLLPGGEGPLMDYAAALAGHRFVLRCLAGGITVAIGDPRSGPAGARSAAKELEEDFRSAASRWLRPKDFCFRRTAAAGIGR